MIDKEMYGEISSKLPTLNHEVCYGLPEIEAVNGETYIWRVLKCALDGLVDGLKCEEPRRCTPYETFNEIVRPHKPSRGFELTQSDTYMVVYNFSYKGEPLRPRYFNHPYISNGSLITLRDTLYNITPVISGRTFTVEKGHLHLNIPRSRLKFIKMPTAFMKNGRSHNVDTPYAYLYNMASASRAKNIYPVLTIYLLIGFGITELFRHYHKCEVVSWVGKDMRVDPSNYHIFTSCKMPVTKKQGLWSEYSDLTIAIPKKSYDKTMDPLIGGIFYIADVRPDAIVEEHLDNKEMWLSILPTFLYSGKKTNQERYDEMVTHIQWLQHYADELTINQLRKDNIHIKTTYDLLHFIVIEINDMVAHYDVGTMYYKEISTVKHLYYNIVHNIFSLMYSIKRIPPERLSVSRLNTLMSEVLRVNKIMDITKHGELSPINIASDLKIASTTATSITQHAAAGKKGKGQISASDPAIAFHYSQPEVASVGFPTKPDPAARNRLNPFLTLSDNGTYIVPRPDNIERAKRFAALLNGTAIKG